MDQYTFNLLPRENNKSCTHATAQMGGVYPSFQVMKDQECFCSPLEGMPIHPRVTTCKSGGERESTEQFVWLKKRFALTGSHLGPHPNRVEGDFIHDVKNARNAKRNKRATLNTHCSVYIII